MCHGHIYVYMSIWVQGLKGVKVCRSVLNVSWPHICIHEYMGTGAERCQGV